MLGESRLNVYILGDSLTARQHERIQAQVQTALQSVPQWSLDLLDRRIEEASARNLPLIIEPLSEGSQETRSLSFGELEGRPAAKLMPRLSGEAIEWGQDRRYMVLKAIAYMASPPPSNHEFWATWSRAVTADGLRTAASSVNARWDEATELDLLIEMFAAFALDQGHPNWSRRPAIRAFMEDWPKCGT